MALFQTKIFSQELYRSVNVNVILPLPDSNNDFFGADVRYPKPGEKYPVLYLLHGFSADESDWQRFSRIESYAQNKNIAVVMPDGYNSFYENAPWGANYYNYILNELPAAMEAIYPISGKRENRFIAGLSMGGYGSFKLALLNPERYCAAASLSGGMYCGCGEGWESSMMGGSRPTGVPTTRFSLGVFGSVDPAPNPEKTDLKCIVKAAAESGKELPKLYQCCGTEDFTYPANAEFRDYARSVGVEIQWEEGPGKHNFDFWDPYIRKILDWLPISGKLVD